MIEGLIFDFGRTLHEIESDQLYPGAEELLSFLKNRSLKLALVSRADDPQKRQQDFARFNLQRFFQVFEVVPYEGTKTFDRILAELGVKPERCLVIGDRIKSEIVEANKAGLTTIWIRQGKFKDEVPENEEETPDFTVNSLGELKTK